MNLKIKLILADDHHILLDGLRSLLKKQRDMEVMGCYNNGQLLLDALPRLGPVDMALIDLSMPLMHGSELMDKIKLTDPNIKVIVLSMHDDAGHVMEMVDRGVSGYLLKNAGDQELLDAIRKVAAGRLYFSQAVSDTIEAAVKLRKQDAAAPAQPRLSSRELEILRLIVNECSNSEIAETLFISERTVETHRKNMLRKMNHKSMVGLLRHALEQKLI